MNQPSYDLHTLGWKAFQDLAIAVAEECLHRPVQEFLASGDAGRDGAFRGRWDGSGRDAGSSTIQCKFTSLPNQRLHLSLLKDELKKATRLAEKGMAEDYIILTNHPVSGASDLKIKEAFEKAGVACCRVFGKDWIVGQILKSSRLRMMVPRLYGLGDLSQILDARAYKQARMILSAMGDDLKRLVVTDSHRRSVHAVTEFNFVLLLGAPAAGKSTIGASLAVGAADMWGSLTIKATSPSEVREHLNPNERQFFWIDDAWGSAQYQRDTIEQWNQLFPLMQGALKRGTQFLLTSRDYMWRAAQRDLKISALPLLGRSQVVIDVQQIAPHERAQILYNHLKMGDQPSSFRKAIKSLLPQVAEGPSFLPETARRLGARFFAGGLEPTRSAVMQFFSEPEEFLRETIANLDSDCRAAIALIFLSSGRVASPIEDGLALRLALDGFGVTRARIRDALNALNGSLLLLAFDEKGPYWTYKHPTVGDAFASVVARDPELTEFYLRGAKPLAIMREVVCGAVSLPGAAVAVPASLYQLLLDRIGDQSSFYLSGFLSYRCDAEFVKLALARRPDLLTRLTYFITPLSEDRDASFLAQLHSFGLLPEDAREVFVERVRQAAVEAADSSFLEDELLRAVLQPTELEAILEEVRAEVLSDIPTHVRRVKSEWGKEYPPDDHFDNLLKSLRRFAEELQDAKSAQEVIGSAKKEVSQAVANMWADYEPTSTVSAPAPATEEKISPLAQVFRDVDA